MVPITANVQTRLAQHFLKAGGNEPRGPRSFRRGFANNSLQPVYAAGNLAGLPMATMMTAQLGGWSTRGLDAQAMMDVYVSDATRGAGSYQCNVAAGRSLEGAAGIAALRAEVRDGGTQCSLC